jgi:hypothetical protein
MTRDEPHPTHVSSKAVHVVEAPLDVKRLGGRLRVAKVEHHEFVRGCRSELWLLDINTTDPIALLRESIDKMVTDESPGTRNEDTLHGATPFLGVHVTHSFA